MNLELRKEVPLKSPKNKKGVVFVIYTCPVCQGSGFVPRKMYEVPGVTCSFGSYMNDNGVIQCNSCNGTGVIRKNDWIKCTDRMPPDMEPVIVTVLWKGNKFVETEVYRSDGCWMKDYDSMDGGGTDYYSDDEITHWMSMPSPAED